MTLNPDQFLPDAGRASAVARIFAHLRKHPSNVVASMIKEMAIAGDADVLSDILDAQVLQNSGFNDMAVGYGILPLLEARGIEKVGDQIEALVKRWLVSFECDDVQRMSDYLQFVDDEATTRQLLARGADPNTNLSRMRGPLPVADALEKRDNEVPWLMLKALKERGQVPKYRSGETLFQALLVGYGRFADVGGVAILSRMEEEGLTDLWRESMGDALGKYRAKGGELLDRSTGQHLVHAKMMALAKMRNPDDWLSLFDRGAMAPESIAMLTIAATPDASELAVLANIAGQGVDMDKITFRHNQLQESTLLLSATYHRYPSLMQVLLEAGCDPYRTCLAKTGSSDDNVQELNAFEIAESRFDPVTTQVLNVWKANRAINGILRGAGKDRTPAV